MPEYSFCEPVMAGPLGPWHIRELTEAGRKLGGGADTESLCGRKMGWDLDVEISEFHLDRACKKCAEAYKAARDKGRLEHLFPKPRGDIQ